MVLMRPFQQQLRRKAAQFVHYALVCQGPHPRSLAALRGPQARSVPTSELSGASGPSTLQMASPEFTGSDCAWKEPEGLGQHPPGLALSASRTSSFTPPRRQEAGSHCGLAFLRCAPDSGMINTIVCRYGYYGIIFRASRQPAASALLAKNGRNSVRTPFRTNPEPGPVGAAVYESGGSPGGGFSG